MQRHRKPARWLAWGLAIVVICAWVAASAGPMRADDEPPFPTLRRPAGALDAAAEVARALDAGRLDREIADAIAGGPVEGLVVLDETIVGSRAAARRNRLGLTDESAISLAAKARDYRSLKTQSITGESLRDYPNLGAALVRFTSIEALAETLRGPGTLAVRADERGGPALAQSLAQINQPAVAALGERGAGVAIAILDTGVDYRRAEFGACTAPGTPGCRVLVSLEFGGDDGLRDDNGHGTNVAAIAGAVAPDARLLALDVFRTSTTWVTSDLLAALDWLIANQAVYAIRAANLSLVVSNARYTTPCAGSTFAGPFANLRAAGILPVISSGNEAYVPGSGFRAGLSVPACVPGAISVGAVYDGATPNPFNSSFCSDINPVADRPTCFSQSASYLAVLAPGAIISAAGSNYSGTSQAAPHVAGAVAVLASARPAAGISAWEGAIKTTGPLISDTRFGTTTRRLDLLAALMSLPGSPTPTPTRTPTPTPTPPRTPSPTATTAPSNQNIAVPAPSGSGVVTMTALVRGGTLSVTLDGLSSAGTLQVETLTSIPAEGAPPGSQPLPTSFRITLSGATALRVEVCLPYLQSDAAGLDEGRLQIFQRTGSGWSERTNKFGVDTVANIVCGKSDALGLFVLTTPGGVFVPSVPRGVSLG